MEFKTAGVVYYWTLLSPVICQSELAHIVLVSRMCQKKAGDPFRMTAEKQTRFFWRTTHIITFSDFATRIMILLTI